MQQPRIKNATAILFEEMLNGELDFLKGLIKDVGEELALFVIDLGVGGQIQRFRRMIIENQLEGWL